MGTGLDNAAPAVDAVHQPCTQIGRSRPARMISGCWPVRCSAPATIHTARTGRSMQTRVRNGPTTSGSTTDKEIDPCCWLRT